MADETNTSKPEIKQPENPIVLSVERNGVTIKLQEQRTTRGQNPGKMVFDPVVSTNEDKEAFLKHVGLENVYGIVRNKYRQLDMEWASDATDKDTEQFQENVFLQLAQTFDASGETMADLEEARDEQLALLVKNAGNPELHPPIVAEIQRLVIALQKKSRPRKVKAVATA